jgi:hypothetical protein
MFGFGYPFLVWWRRRYRPETEVTMATLPLGDLSTIASVFAVLGNCAGKAAVHRPELADFQF